MSVLCAARILSVLVLGALPASALQDDAFYPARDLSAPPAASDLHAATAPGAPGDRPRASVALAGTAFDATQLTPTPDVAVRDLDGDGHLDLTHIDGGVTVWYGQGQGRMGDPVFVPTAIPFARGRWGDVNGDGRLDAVFIPDSVLGDEVVEALVDQGDGTFVSAGLGPLASGNWAFQVGDVDGDGLADIVTQDGSIASGTDLEVFYGLGGSQFSAAETIAAFPGFQGRAIALGDLDGDGLVDVATENHSNPPNILRLFRQLPGGGWQASGFAGLTAFATDRMEIRDLTGDGHADVLVQEYGYGAGGEWTVAIYPGDGTGDVDPVPILVPGAGFQTRFVDLDGDGLVDVLSVAEGDLRVPSAQLARADGTLAPAVLTPHRADPLGVVDLDGDGIVDLFSESVVLFGRGDGGFDAPRGFPLGVTPEKQSQIALADFDEDGRPDVLAMHDADDGLTVAVSDTAATWEVLDLHPDTRSLAVAAGDLDSDGDADVLVQRASDTQQEYWLGRGDGTFAPSVLFGAGFLTGGNTGLVMGQFNGTAWTDIAATGGGELRRKLGLGTLAFGPIKVTPLPPGGSNPWLVAHDLDGDGLDDLLVVQPEVYVFQCIGHGDFEPPVLVDGGATHLRLFDVDGDGDVDLITSDGTQVRVRLGDGQGGFGAVPWAVVDADRAVLGTDLADVDGDGVLDLAVGHEGGWSLHLGVAGAGFEAQPADRFDLPGDAHVLRFVEVNDDARPDLLAVGQASSGVGLSLYPHRGGPWADEGFALEGDAGHPFLWGTGTLLGGSTLGLELRDGAAAAPYHLVVGAAEVALPFKGGVLVPAPGLVVSGFALDAQGQSAVASPWPAGTPPGVSFWLQAWIEDGSGPAGLTASNGLRATTP